MAKKTENHIILFDGRTRHRSLEFTGTRFSFVAFPHQAVADATAQQLRLLRTLGFQPPASTLDREVLLSLKFFWEICAGLRSPLTSAFRRRGAGATGSSRVDAVGRLPRGSPALRARLGHHASGWSVRLCLTISQIMVVEARGPARVQHSV